MPPTKDQKIIDQYESLERAHRTVAAKLMKGSKSDGDEKQYSDTYHRMVSFGRQHGLTNAQTLKRKYRRS